MNNNMIDKLVFTVASRRIPLTKGVSAIRSPRTVGEKDCNLDTKFDSPYLLADIIKKFRTEGTTLQFTHVYLDHYVDDHSKMLQEAALTDFYQTTMPLIKSE